MGGVTGSHTAVLVAESSPPIPSKSLSATQIVKAAAERYFAGKTLGEI